MLAGSKTKPTKEKAFDYGLEVTKEAIKDAVKGIPGILAPSKSMLEGGGVAGTLQSAMSLKNLFPMVSKQIPDYMEFLARPSGKVTNLETGSAIEKALQSLGDVKEAKSLAKKTGSGVSAKTTLPTPKLGPKRPNVNAFLKSAPKGYLGRAGIPAVLGALTQLFKGTPIPRSNEQIMSDVGSGAVGGVATSNLMNFLTNMGGRLASKSPMLSKGLMGASKLAGPTMLGLSTLMTPTGGVSPQQLSMDLADYEKRLAAGETLSPQEQEHYQEIINSPQTMQDIYKIQKVWDDERLQEEIKRFNPGVFE